MGLISYGGELIGERVIFLEYIFLYNFDFWNQVTTLHIQKQKKTHKGRGKGDKTLKLNAKRNKRIQCISNKKATLKGENN